MFVLGQANGVGLDLEHIKATIQYSDKYAYQLRQIIVDVVV